MIKLNHIIKQHIALIFLITLSFTIRVINLASVSLEDYHSAIVSYISATGTYFLGESDFGVRIPFILIGTLLVPVTFSIATYFNPNKNYALVSASLVAFSPALIYLSKTPNEIIILVFFFSFLFYQLMNNQSLKISTLVLVRYAMIVIGIISIFSIFSQTKGGLLENNFSIFSNLTIPNGINTLRGQGLEQGWPNFLERTLFNKVHYLLTGFLHWLSVFTPSAYFGQIEIRGEAIPHSLNIFPKILIIPAFLGLIYCLNRDKRILLILLILTFPAIFMYPQPTTFLTVLTTPFMATVIVHGLWRLNDKLKILILTLALIEVWISIIF